MNTAEGKVCRFCGVGLNNNNWKPYHQKAHTNMCYECSKKLNRKPKQEINYMEIESIKTIVSTVTGISVGAMESKSRKREIVEARQIAMYFLTSRVSGLKNIGKAFGGRDHSTVIHARDTVEDLKQTDKHFYRKFKKVELEVMLCENVTTEIFEIDPYSMSMCNMASYVRI